MLPQRQSSTVTVDCPSAYTRDSGHSLHNWLWLVVRIVFFFMANPFWSELRPLRATTPFAFPRERAFVISLLCNISDLFDNSNDTWLSYCHNPPKLVYSFTLLHCYWWYVFLFIVWNARMKGQNRWNGGSLSWFYCWGSTWIGCYFVSRA